MKKFKSLARALRSLYQKPLHELSENLKARVQDDFLPWHWVKMTPKERQSRAEQWDYENDPGKREVREGIAAITDPQSPAYSESETKRLRGDFLPEKKKKKVVKKNQDPLEFTTCDPADPDQLVVNDFKIIHTHRPDRIDDAREVNIGAAISEKKIQKIEPKPSRFDVQDRRLKDCQEAGFKFDSGRMPDGIGNMAAQEGVSRQTYSQSVKSALDRLKEQKRSGKAN